MSSAGTASIVRSASQRHQAGPSRAVPAPSTPHRSQSQSYRGSPASTQAAQHLANVARRDFEQTTLGHPPPSHPEPPRERPGPSRSDSTRSNHRTSSRADRYASIDAAAIQQPPTNGIVRDATSHGLPPTSGRRRTTIAASTGTWQLGKTIGAGSMGKVKLARNQDTGEQVSTISDMLAFGKPNFRTPSLDGVSRLWGQELKMLPTPTNSNFSGLLTIPSRSQSKSSPDNPPMNIEPLLIESEQITQKRSEPPERLPSSVSSTTPTFAA